jgi:primosomal protein N' (replication factor Y)
LKVFFVDVLLPLALPKAFTYRVPQNMLDFIAVGVRVIVPFGKHKLYTGLIVRIHQQAPTGYTAKYIDDVPDSMQVVNERQLNFWSWISDYYLCTRGEVMLAALPAAMRVGSETKFIPNPAFDGDVSSFSPREQSLLDVLIQREVMTEPEISEVLEVKNGYPIIRRLIDAAAILVMEDMKKGFEPRMEKFVRLAPACSDEEGLEAAFRSLARAPKQEALLMTFVSLSDRYGGEEKEVKRSVLLKRSDASSSQLKELVKKEIFEVYEKETDRIDYSKKAGLLPPELSAAQEKAFEQIRSESRDIILLHGVTSSGKTEIYISLIREQLAAGKQVLYLLPEIALTTQMINRLKAHFGEQVVVYHSRYTQNERVEIWNKVLENDPEKARIVLGARSSVFLPFENLGLVIVDEEHETSYKQFDPAPRYHGRDAGLVLASIHGAKTILGSATPSLESYYLAKRGKYGYVSVDERYGGMELPLVEPVALSGQGQGYFSKKLLEEMQLALDQNEQVILFQNRRGYAPVLICETCGWSPECTRCDVSLTYHKSLERFVCHYCGNKYNRPANCAACGSHSLRLAGFGTERIEEELPIHFPDATVARLDLDSTRSKYAYRQILTDFQNGSIDVLIGTQMITKGLDFDRVSLVGILNADLLLKFPDFRAAERAYQLMTQVAGRAGRKNRRGKVIIQSRDPEGWLIRQVMDGNYEQVVSKELQERRQFAYPPFTRLIKLTFRHRESELVDYCAAEFKKHLLTILPESDVLGPEYPMVARVKNRYHKNILLKVSRNKDVRNVKEGLKSIAGPFFAQKEFKAVRLIINVDPY